MSSVEKLPSCHRIDLGIAIWQRAASSKSNHQQPRHLHATSLGNVTSSASTLVISDSSNQQSALGEQMKIKMVAVTDDRMTIIRSHPLAPLLICNGGSLSQKLVTEPLGEPMLLKSVECEASWGGRSHVSTPVTSFRARPCVFDHQPLRYRGLATPTSRCFFTLSFPGRIELPIRLGDSRRNHERGVGDPKWHKHKVYASFLDDAGATELQSLPVDAVLENGVRLVDFTMESSSGLTQAGLHKQATKPAA